MARLRVHYSDSDHGIEFALCWSSHRWWLAPTLTRNTRKVTCKLCLALLDSR